MPKIHINRPPVNSSPRLIPLPDAVRRYVGPLGAVGLDEHEWYDPLWDEGEPIDPQWRVAGQLPRAQRNIYDFCRRHLNRPGAPPFVEWSRAYIAEQVGYSKQTVGRALASIRRLGLLDIQCNRIAKTEEVSR